MPKQLRHKIILPQLSMRDVTTLPFLPMGTLLCSVQAPILQAETASGGRGSSGIYWATISHSTGEMLPIGSLMPRLRACLWAQLRVLARSLYFHAPMESGHLVRQGTWRL